MSGEKKLLVGREFTQDEVELVRETVSLFPALNRRELAETICELLGWVTPAGRLRTASCLQLLERMERRGEVRLPAKRKPWGGYVPREEPPRLTSRTGPKEVIRGRVDEVGPVAVEPVYERTARELWNEYVQRYHLLGYKRPFGAHQRYFILGGRGEEPWGCLLFGAAAWALAARDEWIGWCEADRKQRLNGIVNNNRLVIFPWVRVSNLASKALGLLARRIRGDWQERYGYAPVLLEAFVERARYRGTCYRAANWTCLGETAGRGRMDRYTKRALSRKCIFVYPLVRDFREYLCGRRPYLEPGVSRDG